MSTIYGSFWDETQIAVGKVKKEDRIPQTIFCDKEGTPAFLAILENSSPQEYIFVESVPGTVGTERYLDLDTGQHVNKICVKVNIYHGTTYKFDDMNLISIENWPLEWFNLSDLPAPRTNPYDDYDRAMTIIGK
jgi:hypothetical protein